MSMMDAYTLWSQTKGPVSGDEFHRYVCSIADGRYVSRKIIRILDDRARQHGLEPLQHQAMLQIYGNRDSEGIRVNVLAARLDIAAAFASRLVSELESRGLVERTPSPSDRRATTVSATEDGIALIRAIDESVHDYIAVFQHELDEQQRASALAIYAFYVGIGPDSAVARAIKDLEPLALATRTTGGP